MNFNKNTKFSKYYKAGGITFQVNSDFLTDNTFHPKFKSFEVDTPGKDNVVVNHHFFIPDQYERLDKTDALLEKENLTIFKMERETVFRKNNAFLEKGKPTNGYFVFNENCSICNVYLSKSIQSDYKNGNYWFLTLLGADQILFTSLLADRTGGLMHSNGFNLNNTGYLIAGVSGVGKSTLSKFLRQKNIEILGDDRMIIKMVDGKHMVFGSWIHGSTPDFSPKSMPLIGIFFPEHSIENKIIRIDTPSDKLKRILLTFVRPFVSQNRWECLLIFIDRLVKDIPCYRLCFDKSGKIVDLILKGEYVSKN